ncbi:hypothetical protein E2C01_050707 [Portunus trituberculatus]|uniref:Uncharacterized protein n=1 Tax=Portunus trituberculatus TaxID=210409 RepID=A0A5B7G9P4_PORTR|nr:hypothetical protein [Portunus trituberculatus]
MLRLSGWKQVGSRVPPITPREQQRRSLVPGMNGIRTAGQRYPDLAQLCKPTVKFNYLVEVL